MFKHIYRDTGGIAPGTTPAGRPELVAVLLFGAIYVYLLQRTYPPGS